MIRTVLTDPAPELRATCTPVTDFDGALGALALDMLQTLYAAQGRGLAAPQIGVTERVFVMDASWKTGVPAPQVFVNPEIVSRSDEVWVGTEQCLSIPDHPVEVARAEWITLQWQDLGGARLEARFTGFDGICIQHERDHLDGILITDLENA